jgi:hypothetical protein
MILETIENKNRAANICSIGNNFTVMLYINNQYIEELPAISKLDSIRVATTWCEKNE